MEKSIKYFEQIMILPITNFKNVYKNFLDKGIDEDVRFFRKPEIKNTKKRPIVLLGCSYTYGTGLKDNETFSHKLSDYTNRSVFNYGIGGAGVAHSIYELETGLHKELINPEYIIYTFIEYHIYRLNYPTSFFFNLLYFYKYDKNGELIPKNEFDLWWWHSYTLRAINQSFMNGTNIEMHYYQNVKLLLKHFLKLKEIASKKYPKSKLVIFAYDGKIGLNSSQYIKSIEKDLKDAGIIIVYMDELTNIDFNKNPYTVDSAGHPSPAVWDIVIPLLSKRLSL